MRISDIIYLCDAAGRSNEIAPFFALRDETRYFALLYYAIKSL